MNKISLRNVWKIYPNAKEAAPAVKDFNLDIADGEFIVFVGGSGCGKSTTLRMIAGLESITKGEIEIDGRIVNDLSPKDRNIAMVFQNYALYPNLSLFENMAFGLRLRKMEKDRINELVNEKAKKLEIDHLLDRLPKDVSGGQRQRVALGRAIVRDPSVFLMDEPLSNLDAKMRVQTRTEITRLHRELGSTTIYVTHDQTEAMTMRSVFRYFSAFCQPLQSICGLVEWLYVRQGRTDEARKVALEFQMKTIATMFVGYLGLAVFLVTLFIMVVTGRTSLPQWACIFNTLPLMAVLALTKLPAKGSIAGAVMYLGLLVLI